MLWDGAAVRKGKVTAAYSTAIGDGRPKNLCPGSTRGRQVGVGKGLGKETKEGPFRQRSDSVCAKDVVSKSLGRTAALVSLSWG